MTAPLALFGPLGTTELLIILGIVVLLFGAKKIPDLARGMGEGIRNFRRAMRDGEESERRDDKAPRSDG